MKKAVFLYAVTLMALHAFAQHSWKLVWADEFSYSGKPDHKKWGYDLGSQEGWGNNELEYYTDDLKNAYVKNGMLVIEARKENRDSFKYTSARLVTKGKASWQHGKIEVRAKLPSGLGSWPAIWMLAENIKKWPDDGEIDIMEHVGYDQGWVHGSIHCKAYNHVIGTQKTAKTFVADASSKFHVYGLEWNKDAMTLSIDNKPYFHFTNEHKGYDYWPFDNKMYLILNIAVGGNWGGQKGVDDKAFPMKMEVDYVRVYQ
ncbi:MAG: glycoside hydrolase family 16 protein [Niabella sp.]